MFLCCHFSDFPLLCRICWGSGQGAAVPDLHTRCQTSGFPQFPSGAIREWRAMNASSRQHEIGQNVHAKYWRASEHCRQCHGKPALAPGLIWPLMVWIAGTSLSRLHLWPVEKDTRRADVCTVEDGLSTDPWQFWRTLKTQKHSPSYKQLRWSQWSSHRDTPMSYLGMLCAQRNNLSCQFSSLVVTKWVINMLCNSSLTILMCIDFILCGKKSSLLIIGCNISPWQRQKLTTDLSNGWEKLAAFAGNGTLSLNTLQHSTGIPEVPLLWGEMLHPLNHVHRLSLDSFQSVHVSLAGGAQNWTWCSRCGFTNAE